MIHPDIDKIHLTQVNRKLDFTTGDTVQVHYKIREGNKERIQVFEGLVIAIQNEGVGKSFIVRRVSFDVGVERIFPLYSPNIAEIKKVRSGRVRRAKLYYLREKEGKQGRLKEIKREAKEDLIFNKAQEIQREEAAKAAEKTESSAE